MTPIRFLLGALAAFAVFMIPCGFVLTALYLGIKNRKPPKCPACRDRGDCEECRFYDCATCHKRVPWSDGCDDEFFEDCSACWVQKTNQRNKEIK